MKITSPQQLQDCLDLAARELLLQNSLTTEMDAEITTIKARYEPKVNKHEKERARLIAEAQCYAVEQRKTLLSGGKKSMTLGGHKLGWQDNGGAVKTIKGTSEKKVIERISKSGGILAKLFLRHKPALDKESISKKWAAYGAKLRAFGLRLIQEELFFVELDVSKPVATRQSGETQA